MSRLRRWMESACDNSREPKWQEPMEWLAIGFTIGVVLMIEILC